KYLNSPQTPLFDKGNNLYGIDRAHSAIRQRGEAVLVEGYFDVLVAHQAGFPNVVGSLGTSLTERQMARLTRLCRRIILAMDPDTAGQHAVERGLEVGRATAEGTTEPTFVWQGLPHFELRRRINADLRILVLPAGQDPDEVIRSSPEQWADLTQNAKGFIEHYFELAAARFNPRAPEQQQAIVAFLAPVIDQLADPFQRSYYLQRLARWLRVDERLILRETQQGSRMTKQTLGNVLPTRSRQSLDEYYVGLLLTHPEWLTDADLAASDDLEHPQGRELVRLLIIQMQHSDRFEIDQFRQTLDPILQEFVEHLIGRAAEQPPLSESTFRAATRQSILKLRERRCRSLLQENHFLLDDAERAGDEGEVTRLKDLARRLGQELGQIFKLQTSVAMGARSH
ncbi:MAG: toprim domain-containing protein, partial [Chloroflexi bacterium]|nr:toprim domain-containing protein [Chloroflexota bacterium]